MRRHRPALRATAAARRAAPPTAPIEDEPYAHRTGPAARVRSIRRAVSYIGAIAALILGLSGLSGTAQAAGSLPCDIYASRGTPCVAAHSTTRALFGSYDGPLYQVTRSDGATPTSACSSPAASPNAAAQDSFCSGTYCTIVRIYDQTSRHNDLTIAPGGDADPTPTRAPRRGAAGDRGRPQGVRRLHLRRERIPQQRHGGIATGSQPEGMYMVTRAPTSTTAAASTTATPRRTPATPATATWTR